ncbi:MAG TPA: hypothetical protein VNN98_06100 [Rhizomicrobium sp.]|nr:hypothetical protein [Rhizomicrobium sp.]
MRESKLITRVWTPIQGTGACALGMAILSLMFLSVAIWNGFPLIFYDTGAYVLEGLGHVFLVERAPVYSELLFLAGGAFSFWPIAVLQALMISYLILEVARAEVPGLTLRGLTVIGAALSLLTGIGWYVGQVEPDIFTPAVILGCWLLLFRGCELGRARLCWVIGLTGLAVACHPSHLGLLGGLLIAAALFKLAQARLPRMRSIGGGGGRSTGQVRRPEGVNINLRRGLFGLVAALCLIVTGNFVLTGNLFISRSGSVFLFARLMQDGIVKRLMNDTCPPAGDIDWRLCAYKNRLSTSANAWLWGAGSGFHALGGFTGKEQQEEDSRIIVESLKRYPVMHFKTAVYDSLLQFLEFKTGDGIEPQLTVLESGFKHMIPGQVPAYLEARQQRGLIRFKTLNLIHVPVGAMSVLGLLLLLWHACLRRAWNGATLPALVLLGLIGNAIICGTFSNPHDRYQSRLIWLPSLALLLAVAKDRRALQPVPESGT